MPIPRSASAVSCHLVWPPISLANNLQLSSCLSSHKGHFKSAFWAHLSFPAPEQEAELLGRTHTIQTRLSGTRPAEELTGCKQASLSRNAFSWLRPEGLDACAVLLLPRDSKLPKAHTASYSPHLLGAPGLVPGRHPSMSANT